MKNRKRLVLGLVVFLWAAMLSAAVACTAEKMPITPASPKTVAASEKPAWQQQWEEWVMAAKKEGTLSIYGTLSPELRAAYSKKFEESFGIKVEYVIGRGDEVAEKLKRERLAGLYLADLPITGAPTAFRALRPDKALSAMKDILILPEVLDPKVWWGGKLLWVDKEETYLLAFAPYVQAPLTINTNIIRDVAAISSYNDLLRPEWKGKIMINDPTTAGMGRAAFQNIGSKIMGLDYMRQLARQEPVIFRDQRLQVEWLAHGKYPVLFAGRPGEVSEFLRVGAPIKPIVPKEGTWLSVTSGEGTVSLADRAPHPNAARVFINWLLSREGQTVYTKASLRQSGRLDVPTDHLSPETLRQPGVPYVVEKEEDILAEMEYNERAREIFGHLIK